MYQGRFEPISCQKARQAAIGSAGIGTSGPLADGCGVVPGFATGFGGGAWPARKPGMLGPGPGTTAATAASG